MGEKYYRNAVPWCKFHTNSVLILNYYSYEQLIYGLFVLDFRFFAIPIIGVSDLFLI